MIPVFPNQKEITLDDKNLVESYTSLFEAYSDFNFVSLWSWNLENKISLSILNDNLVVKFADYATGEPFYSFIGKNLLNETAQKLLNQPKIISTPSSLRLIPEVIAVKLDTKRFTVLEDRDNFDYIYNLNELDELKGSAFSKKRNHVNAFMRQFPYAEARELDLNDTAIITDILSLFKKLHDQRIEKSISENFHDLIILERLLKNKETLQIKAVGVIVDMSLVAVMISELLPNKYSIGHLMGADNTVSGSLYTFLLKKNSEILRMMGAELFNFEQDLGIENLRIAKTRFRPTAFLKKFTVTHSPTI